VGGQVRAAQLSVVFNRGRSVEGLQLALLNRADEAMRGVQLGALNTAGSLSQGLQLSGLNLAGNFEGVQIGLVNVAKRVRGVQIGLINIADDVDGVPIGLVSVTKTGGVHPSVWSSNTTYANVGVKFATRYTYTMLSGAMHYARERSLYGAGFTLGVSIPVHKRIAAEVDLQALHLFADRGCTPYSVSTDQSMGFDSYIVQQDCDSPIAVDALGRPDPTPKSSGFTSATSRAFDQSLAKLRALLRFELSTHLGLFVGTGVTGRVTYPLVNGDTEPEFRLLPEVFGGVQL
jgi:hypothetical protein